MMCKYDFKFVFNLTLTQSGTPISVVPGLAVLRGLIKVRGEGGGSGYRKVGSE